MSDNKISAIIIAYNEEKKIRRCLESLKGVVDEVILVHDGECSDNTLKISEEYGAKIFIRQRIGQAEPHRPFAVGQSAHAWVLFIDADERLSCPLRQNLTEKINSEYDAYVFRWRLEINGESSKFMTKPILFRKSHIYVIGLPHIQPETRGRTTRDPDVLEHDTHEYDSPMKLLAAYYKKNKNWGRVSAEMLSGRLEDIPVYNCNLKDKTLKQIKKIYFVRNFPFLAIAIVPLYSFFYSFFLKKFFLQGILGIVLSLHVSLHAFFTSYYLSFKK